MERRKPITYLSLGCIIPYLSVSKRVFEISKIIGSTNNKFPHYHRIQNLVLRNSYFSIDGVTFSYAVRRELENGEEASLNGLHNVFGVNYDVDQFGNKDMDLALAPGDIVIGNPNLDAPADNNQHIHRIYVQCTVDFEYQQIQIRLPEGTKLRDALRSNIAHFLGKNRVYKLTSLEFRLHDEVLRLPQGLKFHIKELVLPSSGLPVFENVISVITEGSFPLKKLTVLVESPHDFIFETNLLREAESLSIRLYGNGNPRNFLPRLVQLTQKNILVSGKPLPVEVAVAIVRKWGREFVEVGTQFSMEVADYRNFLARLKTQLGGLFPGNRTSNLAFIASLNAFVQVNAYWYDAADRISVVLKVVRVDIMSVRVF